MDLQQQQLQQLSDWLTQTEERIMTMETDAPAKNLEIYKEQIEQHRVNTSFYLSPLTSQKWIYNSFCSFFLLLLC